MYVYILRDVHQTIEPQGQTHLLRTWGCIFAEEVTHAHAVSCLLCFFSSDGSKCRSDKVDFWPQIGRFWKGILKMEREINIY